MDCKEITRQLNQILVDWNSFNQYFDDGKGELEVFQPKYEKLDLDAEKLYEEIYGLAAREFLEFAKSEKTRHSLKKIMETIRKSTESTLAVLSPEERYNVFERQERLFDKIKARRKINSRNYKTFLRMIERGEFDFLEEICGESTYYAINSIFLNLFTDNQTTIEIDIIPEKLQRYFGVYLRYATLLIRGDGGYRLGYGLRGGTIHSQSAKKQAGARMKSGKIFIHGKAGLSAGHQKTGGFLYAQISEGNFADHQQGGFSLVEITPFVLGEIDKGNILVEQSRPGLTRQDNTFNLKKIWYPGNRQDFPVNYLSASFWVPSNIADLESDDVLEDLNSKDQVMIWEKGWELRTFNPTEGMRKGVLIIYESIDHLPELGPMMTGGTIIIENAEATVDQVRAKISSKKTGGTILTRVRSDDGKTRLIDVEEAEYYPVGN